jgi:hypothetical protein
MLGRVTIERATFARGIAVARQDEDENAPEFLSPGHPLVEAALRRLRDEAADPAFVHRFDVEVGSPESLVCSFLLRFVDGDGRTVEERLDAVDVGLTGSTSGSPEEDLVRLGLDAPGSGMNPDRDAIERWRASYPVLVDAARAEAERRAELRRRELVELATRLREEELEALAVWRYEEREPGRALGGRGAAASGSLSAGSTPTPAPHKRSRSDCLTSFALGEWLRWPRRSRPWRRAPLVVFGAD